MQLTPISCFLYAGSLQCLERCLLLSDLLDTAQKGPTKGQMLQLLRCATALPGSCLASKEQILENI